MNNLCQEFRSSEVQEFRHYSFILEFWSLAVAPFCIGCALAPLLSVLFAHRIGDGLLTFCRRSSENRAKIGSSDENASIFSVLSVLAPFFSFRTTGVSHQARDQ